MQMLNCMVFKCSLAIIRFECLNLKCLADPILNKYCEVLGKFSSEIDRIHKVTIIIATAILAT